MPRVPATRNDHLVSIAALALMLATTVVLLALLTVPASAATFTVNNTNNSGAGSLRFAILDANQTATQDTIDINATGTVNLDSALPALSTDMTIEGPGADRLTVRRGTNNDFDAFRIFTVPQGSTVAIVGLTLSNGRVFATSSLENAGGAINNFGNLVLVESAVRNNTAVNTNEFFSGGGGIFNGGRLTVFRSEITDNTATRAGGGQSQASGGGILNVSSDTVLTLQNTTVSGNSADSAGGGVYHLGDDLRVNDSTFARNRATDAGANLFNWIGVATFSSSIVTNALGSAPSCTNVPGSGNTGDIVSQGYNVDNGNSCGFDQASDQPNTNPLLDPLALNGGTTRTHALPQASRAIDAGAPLGPAVDQRGEPRPSDIPGVANRASSDGSDAGAYELQRQNEPPPDEEPPPDGEDPPPGGEEPPPGEAPRCKGQPATLVGTGQGETITGTTGRDVIVAGGGADVVRSLGGPDLVCSQGGRDEVRLAGGNDRGYAGGGRDRLFGGGGNDILAGQGGPDSVKGQRGNDDLRGGGGKDTLVGGPGNDVLKGGGQSDTCRGGRGRDSERSC